MFTVTVKVKLCVYDIGVRRIGGIAALFLNLGTSLKAVVNFTRQVFYFRGGNQCTQWKVTRWVPEPCLDLLELKNNFFMPRRKPRFLDCLTDFFCIKHTNTHITLFYCEKLTESNELEDQGVELKIILMWFLGNSNGRIWSSGFIWIFALLECYAAMIGSYLSTFRNNLSVPPSRIKQSSSWCSLLCANNVAEIRSFNKCLGNAS
jgi:hypothetical protein